MGRDTGAAYGIESGRGGRNEGRAFPVHLGRSERGFPVRYGLEMSARREPYRDAEGRVLRTARRRVEAALAGAFPVEGLSDEEGVVFDVEVHSRLEARLWTTNLGAVLAGRGITAVALNEQGDLTEYWPDGTTGSI